MIKLENVSKKFFQNYALKNISFNINKGETLAIIGGSGSGKSTLLRLLIGLIKPTEGEIYYEGEPMSKKTDEEWDKARLKMGMVFQYSALFDSMTVFENVAFGLREHKNLSEEEIAKIVQEKLELVGLPKVANLMPNELSGGMKKRVSLARACAYSPSIIFYDEPSSGLDPVTTRKIDELITDTQKALKVTSVVVTHDMLSAVRIADRIAMVDHGDLVAIAPTEEFRKIDDIRIKEFFKAFGEAV